MGIQKSTKNVHLNKISQAKLAYVTSAQIKNHKSVSTQKHPVGN